MVKCEYCQRDLLKGLNDENVRRHKEACKRKHGASGSASILKFFAKKVSL